MKFSSAIYSLTLITLVSAVTTIASCSAPPADAQDDHNPTSSERIITTEYTVGGGHTLHKVCDNGRAIYVISGFNSVAVTSVETASECYGSPVLEASRATR